MKSMTMKNVFLVMSLFAAVALSCPVWSQQAYEQRGNRDARGQGLSQQQAYDIRGQWEGKAQGTIFGAEGTVLITYQKGEEIQGVVQGGNMFGTAKFGITGKIRGNYIFGDKEGNTFNGYLYSDGTIRGLAQAVTGEKFQVFLRRPYNYWGMPQNGAWQ
jgi:hypothetical protein